MGDWVQTEDGGGGLVEEGVRETGIKDVGGRMGDGG